MILIICHEIRYDDVIASIYDLSESYSYAEIPGRES